MISVTPFRTLSFFHNFLLLTEIADKTTLQTSIFSTINYYFPRINKDYLLRSLLFELKFFTLFLTIPYVKSKALMYSNIYD